VNSEYYSGWLQYWGEAFPRIPIKPFTTLLRSMLENNISVSVYMVHGGTNFGFTAGIFTYVFVIYKIIQ
jgi:beta-galactosidase